MSEQLPNLADLSHAEKDDLILRLFDERVIVKCCVLEKV